MIVFISYPKSGRTWMRYIFHLIGCEVKFTHADHGTMFSRYDPGMPFTGIKTSQLAEKNIFMYRNPLDTAVSMFFQIHKHDLVSLKGKSIFRYIKMAVNKTLPPKDINQFILHPMWGIEKICQFNRAWIDYFDQHPEGLIITYEEASEDLAGIVNKFVTFLDLPPIDAESIAKQSDFDSMKKIESKGKSKELRLYGQKNGDPDTMKVRKGVVRGYRDYLDSETIIAAEKIASRYQFDI